MNIYLIIVGVFSIIAGLLLRYLPKFQQKPQEYASNKARRLATLDKSWRGMLNILLGISFIGMQISGYFGISIVILSLIIAFGYFSVYMWIVYRTPNDEPINYDI